MRQQGPDHWITPEIPADEEREYNKESHEERHPQSASELVVGHAAMEVGRKELRMEACTPSHTTFALYVSSLANGVVRLVGFNQCTGWATDGWRNNEPERTQA